MAESKNQLSRRQFLAGMGGMGAVAAIFAATGGSTGSQGPAGPNQPGTTNRLPRWTNGPGGILGDSHVSDDGSNVILSESLLPNGDETLDLGTALLRYRYGQFKQLYTSSPGTVGNPDVTMTDMSLFRIGPNEIVIEANAPDPTWSALAVLPLGGPGAPNGAPTSGVSSVFVQDSNQANHNSILMGFDHANSLFVIAQSRVGGSANYPILFKSIGVESFRIETDQSVRFSITPRPISDNTIDDGTTALRWAHVYALIMNSGSSDLTLTPNSAVVPGSDNAKDMGTAALRWRTEYLSNSLQVLAAASDANSTLKLSASQLEFGPGGATALDNKIARISATDLRISLNGVTVLDIAAGSIATVAQPFLRTNTGNGNFVINPGVIGGVAGHAFVAFDQGGGLIVGNTSLRPQAAGSQVIGGALGVGVNDSGVAGDGKFNGQLKSRGKNVLLLDGQSMTQSSHTISNADTDIATYSLGANSYTRMIVRVTGYVSFATLSTNQSINLKIKDGSTQVGNTMVVDGALSANASIPFTLEAAFVETGAVTLHFTEGAAAADANTTVFINSIIVLAES